MEIISPILGFFSTYVIDPIGAKFQVSRNLEDNKKELEMSRDNLVARRDDQRGEVEHAKMQEMVEETQEAKLWFSQVDGVLSDVTNLLSELNGRSGPGRYCFCWSRYQLSKRVLKDKQIVGELYEKAQAISVWTAAPALQKGTRLETVSLQGQPKIEKLKLKIIDAVLDDRYAVVGLYGMGGVGKTTLLRHANEHFRKTTDYESVIFTTVSSTPDFVEIRKEIARSLRLDLEKDQDDNDLKEKLSCLLETRKYLLILDDMWEPVIDLGEICNIPAPKKENGCKILMASRSKSVATRFVIPFAARDSLQLIPVHILSPEEAWNLFVQKVGTALTSKPEIKPLAKEVLRKCSGLPLAIVVIGGTMSTRETEGEWKDAIRELGQQSTSKLEGMEKVLSILKFSFDKLEQIEQSFFLYCCLFPEDSTIWRGELVIFAIGEETLCGMQLGEIRNKVDVLIGKLRNSSMLEDGDYSRTIKMHDVMRELGVWITSTTSNKYYIAKARARITEAPNALEWYKATKISLIQNEIESLPQLSDQCPILHTLLLRDNHCIKEIPKVHFLEHMPALQILDLSFTSIDTLPPSISHLVNLRLLRLNRCEDLQELPPEIGMLIQLMLLDLSFCKSLRKLPMEMKHLNNLRRMDINHTQKLKRISPGVLSGLHKLEELNTSFSGLILDTNNLIELSQLSLLTSFSIQEIRKVKVSAYWFKPIANKFMRDICLRNCVIDPLALSDFLEDHSPSFGRIVMMFSSCEGLTSVPTRGYTWLTVQDCPDLKTLLIIEEVNKNAFESLFELRLDRLEQFETICTGIPQPEYGCFTNLEYMAIQACPNLKELFTNGVTQLLKKLRELHVYQCSQLVKIVSDKGLEIDAFPSLKKILLCELPELIAICHLDLNWPSLSTAHVYLCPNLRKPRFGAQRTYILSYDEMDSHMTRVYLDEKRREEERIKKEKEEEDDEDEEGSTSS